MGETLKRTAKILLCITILNITVFAGEMDFISDKLNSSVKIFTFPFTIIARPFVMSSGAELEMISIILEGDDTEKLVDELSINQKIKDELKAQGIKKKDKITADKTEIGIFLSVDGKVVMFLANSEEAASMFSKEKW